MLEKLAKLIGIKDQYDEESQDMIKSWGLLGAEIEQIDVMKRSQGWKILDKKIREELHTRILKMVESDQKIQTLLSLLNVASTHSTRQSLEEEIDKLLPQ